MSKSEKQISYLEQAIKKNDSEYIQEFINLPDTEIEKEVSSLSSTEKEDLLYLLKNNLNDYGLDVRVLKIAKIIILQSREQIGNDLFCKSVDRFCSELGRRTNEYGKMVYLKGKIEYLRYKIENALFNEVEPKQIINVDSEVEKK